jgi:hypothetical protein
MAARASPTRRRPGQPGEGGYAASVTGSAIAVGLVVYELLAVPATSPLLAANGRVVAATAERPGPLACAPRG